MKQFLKIITASSLISSFGLELFACSIPTVGDIWIITDGGNLFDKAFNEQVLVGTQDFADTFNKYRFQISNLPNNEIWKNNSIKYHWIISHDSDISTLQNNYNIAAIAGAKTIILAGFHHLDALVPIIQDYYKKLGIRFILVDAKLDNPINVAGLTYAAEQSGFLAGLAGAIWLAANHELYDSNGLKMSTFGAFPAATIISYMMGYYWGIYYFNNYHHTDSDILKMVNAIRKANKKQAMKLDDLNNLSITFDKLKNQFTGGFDPATDSSKAINSELIEINHNAIVMPVAGAQTQDLVSAIKESNSNKHAKIIGVDTDQSIQYDYAKDTFITSALKGIKQSVNTWLWHAFALNFNNDSIKPVITIEEDGSDYFNGVKIQDALGNKEYSGISHSVAIDAIYDTLINKDEKYWNLAKRVTSVFKKLAQDLASVSKPDWNEAWQKDVDSNNDTYKPNFN